MEETPMKAETFLDRLNTEKRKLDERTAKLQDFMNSPRVNDVSQYQFDLLTTQLAAMKLYSNILHERLKDLDKSYEA